MHACAVAAESLQLPGARLRGGVLQHVQAGADHLAEAALEQDSDGQRGPGGKCRETVRAGGEWIDAQRCVGHRGCGTRAARGVATCGLQPGGLTHRTISGWGVSIMARRMKCTSASVAWSTSSALVIAWQAWESHGWVEGGAARQGHRGVAVHGCC